MKWLVRIILLVVLVGAGAYQFYLWQRPLAPRLVSNDNDTRSMALPELMKLDPAKRTVIVTDLLQYQNDPDKNVRRNALYALRQIGQANSDVLAFCIKALNDPDPSVGAEATVSLSRYAASSIPFLINELGRPDGKVLDGVIHALAGLKEKSVPPLSVFLKDPALKGHANGLRVLQDIGAPAKGAEPVLKGLLASSDPDLRLGAAEVLQGLDLLPKNAVPRLSKDLLAAKDGYKNDRAPRPRLAKVLEKADPRRRTLVDLKFDLKQKNPVVRYRAAYVISEMNPPNIGAMEMLVDALNDPDVTVAARAMAALSRMGLEHTERLKKVAEPRMRNAVRRARAAQIEGFDDVVKLP